MSNDDEEEYEEQEQPGQVAPELQAMNTIDSIYHDRRFADDVEYMNKIKLNAESIISVKEMQAKSHDYFFKRSQDKIRDAKRFEEELTKQRQSLQKTHRENKTLKTWVEYQDLTLHAYYEANASSLQLMTMYAVLIPRLIEELQKVYAMGAKNYMNQQTEDRVKEAMAGVVALLAHSGQDPQEIVRMAEEKYRKEQEKLRMLALGREENKRETIEREVFRVILDKTNFDAKIYPKKTDIYLAVAKGHDDVNEAIKRMRSRGLMQETGRGKGVAKRVILKSREFIPEKVHPKGPNEYGNSRENTPPAITGESPEPKNRQNEAKAKQINAEGVMEEEMNQDADYSESDGQPNP